MSTKSSGQHSLEIDWLLPQTREILFHAQQEAKLAGSTSIQLEHILLGVLVEGSSHEATLLKRCGLDVDTLRAHIDAVYANNPLSREDGPPLSRQAEECVQNAIAMITYYLTRHRPSAKVAAKHLILSIISYPGNLRLQTAYPIRVATLRQQLIADMEPEFLHHSDKLLQSLRSQSASKHQERHTEVHHKHHASQEEAIDKGGLNCSACLQPIQASWKYCTYCGHEHARRCPHCSAPSPSVAGARFCIECGHKLS